MKLSVIVIPRISPSTAAAQCQVVPYTKPPFSSNKATAASFILPKKFLQSLLPSPQKQYLFSSFSSSILISSHLPIYFCVPVTCTLPCLTQDTSLSPLPHQPLRKKPLLPMRRRSLSFHEPPFFHFGSIVHVDGIGRSGVPMFEVDDG